MKNTMGDYTIPMISESSIVDVFPYFSGEEDDLASIEKFNALKAVKTSVVALGDSILDIEEDILSDLI